MSTTPVRVGLAGAAVLAIGTVLAGTPVAAAPAGTSSLSTVLSEDGNRFDDDWHDLDIAEKAVRTVIYARPDSPLMVLSDGSAALTAFLPTDQAFRRLVKAETGERLRRERGVFRNVKQLLDVEALEQVLLYHVVPGGPLTFAKARHADGTVLTTAQGGDVTLRVKASTLSLLDLDPDAADARAVPGMTDINRGSAQIAHGISRVLRPTDL